MGLRDSCLRTRNPTWCRWRNRWPHTCLPRCGHLEPIPPTVTGPLPWLDWWCEEIPGRTPGNRILMGISRELKGWLESEMAIRAWPLAYSIEGGGIFLKDAAVLAGLGIVGRHNLFLSLRHGSRLRLRGLFLDRGYEAVAPAIPSPCADCHAPCHGACPEEAFSDGRFDVKRCEPEMQRNREGVVTVDGAMLGLEGKCRVEQFCRACELACPVGSRDPLPIPRPPHTFPSGR